MTFYMYISIYIANCESSAHFVFTSPHAARKAFFTTEVRHSLLLK